ncbi:hypothetical protein [Rothia aeria]|uniref:hypothetical protein n=1 Tax=Rothia aeria TaxID=172042 RepID=UPI00288A4A7B|nr:hypothetical protein [Rothia aeria]
MNNGSVILLLVSFGFIALMYVVLYVLVRWGNKRERVRQQQQRQITDPVVLVRVLASVRLQASWFMKMLLWVLLIMLALILYTTIQLRISGAPLDTGDWVSAGLLIVFTPGAVWGLWVCRVSYREILPEKLVRVTNRGRKLTLHYWQIDSSYFTLLGDENGLFELTDTAGVVHRFKPHVEPCRYVGSQVAFRLDYGYWADPNNSEDAQVLVRFMQDKYWVQRLLEVPVVSGLAHGGYGKEYCPAGGPEFGPEFRSRQSASGDFTWAKNFVLT